MEREFFLAPFFEVGVRPQGCALVSACRKSARITGFCLYFRRSGCRDDADILQGVVLYTDAFSSQMKTGGHTGRRKIQGAAPHAVQS